MNESEETWAAEAKKWKCHHFSVTWSDRTTQDFLREIASKLDELGCTEVLDISFSQYWSKEEGTNKLISHATVYYD